MRRSSLAVVLLLALAGGCAEVQVVGSTHLAGPGGATYDPDSTWYLNGDVWGFTLFGKVPLVTGSVERPGRLAWFEDTVTLEGVVRLLEDAAAALGADELHEVRTDILSSWSLLGFWLPEARASAVAVRAPAVHAIAPLEPCPPPPPR